MQIQFGNLSLSLGNKVASAGPLRIAVSGSVQLSPLVRSTNAKGFNRKNYRTEVSFGVDYLVSTLDSAENMVETQGEVIKAIGVADLKMTNSGSASVRTLKNAHCTSISASYTGVTVHFEYSFNGEYIT